MNSLHSLGDDKALFVAEQIVDYCHKKEQKERRQRLAYIQHKKDLKTSRKLTAFFSTVVFLIIGLCVSMVSLNIQVKQKEEQIALLEAEVSAAKKENKEAEKRLAGQEDYKWIKKEAEKLGMSRVTPDRVYYYTVEEEDFMTQFRDVPNDTRQRNE